MYIASHKVIIAFNMKYPLTKGSHTQRETKRDQMKQTQQQLPSTFPFQTLNSQLKRAYVVLFGDRNNIPYNIQEINIYIIPYTHLK